MKHLFRSLTRARRAYKDTRNHALTLLHRASAAVLTAVLVYKALTYLLFLPAMNGIWSLTLRCSPVNYLTNNNAHQIFTSPTILGGIVLIVLLAAFFAKAAGCATAAGMYMSGNLTAVEATILFPACITMGTLIGHFARIVLVCKVRALYYPVMFATPIIDAVIVMFLTRLVLVLMGY